MIQMLAHLEMSQSLLILSLFFQILISSFCSDWMFIPYVPNYWFVIPVSFPLLLVPCRFFFISLSVTFISSFMLLPYPMSSLCILITVFWTLPLVGWLSPFCLVLFWAYYSVLSFGLYFFVSSIWQLPWVCLCILGRGALTPCLNSVAHCRKGTRPDEYSSLNRWLSDFHTDFKLSDSSGCYLFWDWVIEELA